jgi:hypothetical protein
LSACLLISMMAMTMRGHPQGSCSSCKRGTCMGERDGFQITHAMCHSFCTMRTATPEIVNLCGSNVTATAVAGQRGAVAAAFREVLIGNVSIAFIPICCDCLEASRGPIQAYPRDHPLCHNLTVRLCLIRWKKKRAEVVSISEAQVYLTFECSALVRMILDRPWKMTHRAMNGS